jgi:hypothetical protein
VRDCSFVCCVEVGVWTLKPEAISISGSLWAVPAVLLAQPAAKSSSANAPLIKLILVGKCLIGNRLRLSKMSR